jgi:hypothetical protein
MNDVLSRQTPAGGPTSEITTRVNSGGYLVWIIRVDRMTHTPDRNHRPCQMDATNTSACGHSPERRDQLLNVSSHRI